MTNTNKSNNKTTRIFFLFIFNLFFFVIYFCPTIAPTGTCSIFPLKFSSFFFFPGSHLFCLCGAHFFRVMGDWHKNWICSPRSFPFIKVLQELKKFTMNWIGTRIEFTRQKWDFGTKMEFTRQGLLFFFFFALCSSEQGCNLSVH